MFTQTFELRLVDRISGALGGIGASLRNVGSLFTNLQNGVGNSTTEMGGKIQKLKTHLDSLYEQQDSATTLPQLANINRQIQAAEAQMSRLRNVGVNTGGGIFQNFKSDLMNAIPAIGLLTNPITLAGGAMGFATHAAVDMNTAMAELNSTLLKSPEELDILKQKILAVSEGKGVADIGKVPLAFNRIVSAGFDTEKSLSILEPSLKASAAGFADLEETATATASVMSVLPNITPTRALDVMFATVNAGNVKFKDLANYMPELIPVGRGLGFEFEELAGTFAYLTSKGRDAAGTAALMKNGFSAISSSDMVEDFKKLGVHFYNNNGQIKSLLDIATQISGKIKGMTEEQRSLGLGSIIKDSQARDFWITMASYVEDLGRVTKITTDATAEGIGMLDYTFQKTGNSARDFAEAKNKLGQITLKFGESILPIVTAGMELFGSALEWVSNHTTGVAYTIGALSGAYLAFNGVAAITGGVSTAFTTLNAVLLANPIGLVVGGLVALGTGLVYAYNHSERFRAIIDSTFAFIQTFATGVLNYFISRWEMLCAGIKAGKEFLTQIYEKFTFLQTASGVLSTSLQNIGMGFKQYFGAVYDIVGKVWDKISGFVSFLEYLNPFTGALKLLSHTDLGKAVGDSWDNAKSAATETYKHSDYALNSKNGSFFSGVSNSIFGNTEKAGTSNVVVASPKSGNPLTQVKDLFNGNSSNAVDKVATHKKGASDNTIDKGSGSVQKATNIYITIQKIVGLEGAVVNSPEALTEAIGGAVLERMLRSVNDFQILATQ